MFSRTMISIIAGLMAVCSAALGSAASPVGISKVPMTAELAEQLALTGGSGILFDYNADKSVAWVLVKFYTLADDGQWALQADVSFRPKTPGGRLGILSMGADGTFSLSMQTNDGLDVWSLDTDEFDGASAVAVESFFSSGGEAEYGVEQLLAIQLYGNTVKGKLDAACFDAPEGLPPCDAAAAVTVTFLKADQG